MKVAVLVLLFALAAVTQQHDFESWAEKHGKTYSSWTERAYRQDVYLKNLDRITRHNKKYEAGEVSYSMAMNKHGDLSHEEFRKHRSCYRGNGAANNETYLRMPKVHYHGTAFLPPVEPFTAPDELDLRNVSGKSFVTHVKDQGACGSCWSFSSTGALEGQIFRKTGKLPSLSEQQLVDCATRFGNFGCDGGDMPGAFLYTMTTKGLMSEEDYPYTAEDGECQYRPAKAVAGAAGYMYVKEGDEEGLKLALALNGPLAIAIDASQDSFQFYSKGVYDEPNCSSEDLDHAVLAVGYGTFDGVDYFLVKNSWGTDWGVDGYILMSRNAKNQCGVASEAVLPLVKPY